MLFSEGSLWNKYSQIANIGINIHFIECRGSLVGASFLAMAECQPTSFSMTQRPPEQAPTGFSHVFHGGPYQD
ncbi:hypothetical protein, partial [Pseudomonas sp. N8]|uniref:hypothetical protein n=1 Tax=Pseudomonas sp. N8 TaxID=3449428 RepID=UPI003F6959FD